MIAVPHASWAEVYDLAYERIYGSTYQRLTDATLRVIARLLPEPARIVDFGAGTGRLSIPLAMAGHDVISVDPCAEMLEQLMRKAEGLPIATTRSTMADFEPSSPADLALSVFTVLTYVLDEDSLRQSLMKARQSLKEGGCMLIDVALPALFRSFEASDEKLTRRVVVEPSGANCFLYEERLTVKRPDGGVSRFEDRFTIRLWEIEEVLRVARAAGFRIESDLSTKFAGSGSNYFLLRAFPSSA